VQLEIREIAIRIEVSCGIEAKRITNWTKFADMKVSCLGNLGDMFSWRKIALKDDTKRPRLPTEFVCVTIGLIGRE